MAVLGGRNYLRVDVAGDLPTLAAADDGTLAVVLADAAGIYRVWDGAAWQTPFDALAPTTTKGDLIVHDGTDNVRLPVAGNDYSTIVSDSTDAEGLVWRVRTELVTIFSHPTIVVWAPGATFAPFTTSSSECLMRRDMRPYHEARIYVRGSFLGGAGGGVDVKIVDTDNGHDMTGTVSITNASIESQISTWFTLHPDTIADNNCAFEAQGQEVNPADSLRTRVITVEFR